jgi:PPOX class probable FMN-dependent enzyme
MVQVTDIETQFDNQFTRQFGFPKERPATKVHGLLQEKVRDFISQSPMLIMATSAADGKCDASPKGGKPGWVKILDDSRVLIPDVAGNRLFQSYLNMAENPQVALIFFIPGIRETVRVNGTVEIVDRSALDELQVELQVFNPDENAKILQGIVVHVEESYGHCPRALAFSRFWDPDRIAENSKRS